MRSDCTVFRALISFLAAASLTSCGQVAEPDSSAISDLQIEWTRLADQSKFGRTNGDGDFDTAIRCWDGVGDYAGFHQCLEVSKHAATGSVSVGQMTTGKLPKIAASFGSTENGYGCGNLTGRYENISKDGEVLISNKGVPWSAGFVASFMADNDVRGDPWFRCIDVLDVIQNGSIGSLGTTSVTREMAGV